MLLKVLSIGLSIRIPEETVAMRHQKDQEKVRLYLCHDSQELNSRRGVEYLAERERESTSAKYKYIYKHFEVF